MSCVMESQTMAAYLLNVDVLSGRKQTAKLNTVHTSSHTIIKHNDVVNMTLH